MRMNPVGMHHEDPREIGLAFMKALPDDASWKDSPVEVFTQALAELERLRAIRHAIDANPLDAPSKKRRK